jgi:coenzyme F420-reducing hydrogenase alpha subunit
MRAVVPQILPLGQAAVTHRLEMLVRAYDPCISCATHMLDVEFRDS